MWNELPNQNADLLRVSTRTRLSGVAHAGAVVSDAGYLEVNGVLNGDVLIESMGTVAIAGVSASSVTMSPGATFRISGVFTGTVDRRGGEVLVSAGTLLAVGRNHYWLRPDGVLERAEGAYENVTTGRGPWFVWEEGPVFTLASRQ